MVEEMQGFHDNQARAFAEQAATITALRDRVAEVERERGLLADAIANAAQKAGIYNGEVALTGPHLLMLADDMADNITAAEAAIARLRDEVIEECAGVADIRADAWTESGNFMGDGYGDGAHATAKEIATALRALNRDTHHETR